MPKKKTHRGAAKRFKLSKSGKVKYRGANRSHILTKKSAKRKRRMRKKGYLAACDAPNIKAMLS